MTDEPRFRRICSDLLRYLRGKRRSTPVLCEDPDKLGYWVEWR